MNIDINVVSSAITFSLVISFTTWGFAYGLNKVFGIFRMLLK